MMWDTKEAMLYCAQVYQTLELHPLTVPKASKEEKRKNKECIEKLKQEQDMERVVSMFLEDGTLLDLTWMQEEERMCFYTLSKQFVEDAKAFDETLENDDIFQALRNIWIIWMLELLFDKPLHYHQAMFAYSMLYPYSDNYLDDEQVCMEDKQNFNDWFLNRLHGEVQPITHPLLQHIDALVGMIEDQFDREVFHDVYESLYLIQEAQMASLKQQVHCIEDIFSISIYKGGASVIADGYLIDGTLTKDEFQFCVDFGFGLQISDDLQDEVEDREHQHDTLATNCKTPEEHWALFCRCWFFLKERIECFPCNRECVKVFVCESCLKLLASCALQNEEAYPKQKRDMIHDAMPMEDDYLTELSGFMKEKMEGFAV